MKNLDFGYLFPGFLAKKIGVCGTQNLYFWRFPDPLPMRAFGAQSAFFFIPLLFFRSTDRCHLVCLNSSCASLVVPSLCHLLALESLPHKRNDRTRGGRRWERQQNSQKIAPKARRKKLDSLPKCTPPEASKIAFRIMF